MKSHPYPGLFIAFEGLDGSGSSTQVEILTRKLNEEGYFAYSTKEPTNNLIGGLIRGALTKDWHASNQCLQLLFAADRAHHFEREIKPILKTGGIIICDRYLFSSVAFGSIDLDKNWLLEINSLFYLPDVTFLMKVSPKVCLKRIGENRTQFELFEEREKLKKVWVTYNKLAQKKEFRITSIDGERSINQISEEIFLLIKKFLKRKKELKRKEESLFTKK